MDEGGDRGWQDGSGRVVQTNPVLSALKDGHSGQPPPESRAESPGAMHHCGQIGLGRTGDHLPPGFSPFRSCQDSSVPQGFLHPGDICELLENHDF